MKSENNKSNCKRANPLIYPRVGRPVSRWTALSGTAAIVMGSASASAANLLVDPSFELKPLNSYAMVLNDFATYQGEWGVENASITGTVGGVTPAHLTKMLSMFDDGLTITQGVQVIDVSTNPLISGGGATFSFSALFNTENAPTARASIFMQFFTGPGLGFEIPASMLGASLNLDSSPGTWESISLSNSIPAGTTWMVAQVGYWDATMSGQPGYVDAADFTIIPAPASACLVPLGMAVMGRRRR